MPQYRPLNADHPVYNGVFHIRDNVAGQVDHVSDTCDDTYRIIQRKYYSFEERIAQKLIYYIKECDEMPHIFINICNIHI